MTPEQIQRLTELREKYSSGQRYVAPSEPTPPAERPGFFSRMGQVASNTLWQPLVRMGGNIGQSVINAATGGNYDTGAQDALMMITGRGMENTPGDEIGFDVPEAQSGWETAADITGSVLGSLPSYISGTRALSALGRAGGLSQTGARIFGAAGTGAAMGGVHGGAKESAIQAGEFGLQEASMMLLPRSVQPIGRALFQGASGAGIGTAGQLMRGNDISSPEALTHIGIMGALPAAMEGRGIVKQLFSKAEPKLASPVAEPTVADFSEIDAAARADDAALALRKQRDLIEHEASTEGRFTAEEMNERARIEYEADALAELRMHEESAGNELLQTIKDLGGLPSLSKDSSLRGEVKKIFETTRGKQIRMQLVRKSQPLGLDKLNESLKQYGFQFDTPAQMLEAVGEAIDGARIVAYERPMEGSRLRPLGESGAVSPVLLGKVAATGAVAAASDEENRVRNTALAAGALFGVPMLKRSPELRQQMQELAGKKLTGTTRDMSFGQRALANIQRFGERFFNLDRDAMIGTIKQQAMGRAETLAGDIVKVVRNAEPVLRKLTQPQKQDFMAYLRSDRGPQAEWFLKNSGLPKEAVDSALAAVGIQKELQGIWQAAQSDPQKAALIAKTLGSWQTTAYEAYLRPQKWGHTQAQFDAVVKENMQMPQYAGMSRQQIVDDVKTWLREVKDFDGDFYRMATEGKSRMSRSAFINKKMLTPAVRDILGEIKDPWERQVLSVTKLAEGAAAAQAVTDFAKLSDARGVRLAMTQAEREAAITAASAKGDSATVSALNEMVEVPDNSGLGVLAKSTKGEKMYAQRQVLDAMKAGPGFGGKLPQWAEFISKGLGAINAPIKAVQTVWNSSTHMRNLVQIPFQAIGAGVGPLEMVKNLRRVADSGTYRNSGKTLGRLAMEDNMASAHLGFAELRSISESMEAMMSKGVSGAWARTNAAVKKLYGISDKLVRTAAYVKYMDEAEKMKMPVAAARRYAVEMTNRYTHNYSNVSEAVGIARNIPLVNPFLSYTAETLRIMKNRAEEVLSPSTPLKRRAEAALAIAGFVGLGEGMKAVVENFASDEKSRAALEAIRPVLPDFERGRLNASVGKGGEVDALNLNPFLPAGDIVSTAQGIISGDWAAVFASNPIAGARSPLWSMASEISTGRNPFSGKQNYGTYERFVEPVLKTFLPPLAPPAGRQFKELRDSFSENSEGGLGITDPLYGRTRSPKQSLLSLSGVSVKSYDMDRVLNQRFFNLDKELSDAKSEARAILRTNASAPAKKRAEDAFYKKAGEIQRRKELLLKSAGR